MWNGAVGNSWNAERKTVNEKPHITKKRGVNRRSGGNHSDLSAMTGSTRDARQAGTALASAATAVSSTATAANVAGSAGVTPCSSPRSRRVMPKASTSPAGDADQRQRHAAAQHHPQDVERGPRRSRRESRSRACGGSPRRTARRRCRSPTASAPGSAKIESSTLVKRGVDSAVPTTSSIVRTSATGRFGSIWRIASLTGTSSAAGVPSVSITSVIDANQVGVAERLGATACAGCRTSPSRRSVMPLCRTSFTTPTTVTQRPVGPLPDARSGRRSDRVPPSSGAPSPR